MSGHHALEISVYSLWLRKGHRKMTRSPGFKDFSTDCEEQLGCSSFWEQCILELPEGLGRIETDSRGRCTGGHLSFSYFFFMPLIVFYAQFRCHIRFRLHRSVCVLLPVCWGVVPIVMAEGCGIFVNISLNVYTLVNIRQNSDYPRFLCPSTSVHC